MEAKVTFFLTEPILGPIQLLIQSMLGAEERRLLGYKNPVRTSQETHYVSATESSRLMLCNI
jgi:hypothetical protein